MGREYVVLVCGCREKWMDEDERMAAIAQTFFRIRALKEKFKERLVVLTGGASGVDTYAMQAAQELGIPLRTSRPDYQKYGKRAPLIRDEQMVDHAHHVIGFWNGVSSGTGHTLKYAREMRVSHEVHYVNNRRQYRRKKLDE